MPTEPTLTRKEIATLFAQADWHDLLPYLRRVAYGLLERDDEDEADELVAEAYNRVWAGITTGKGRRWDPEKYELKKYMAWVVVSVFRHKLETHYEQDRVHFEEGQEPVAVEPSGHAVRVLREGARIEKGNRRIEDTRARLQGLSLLVFDAIVDQSFYPAVFAAHHDVSIDEVNAARQLAKYHWKAVIDASPDSSGPISAGTPAAADVDDVPGGEES